MTPFNYWSIFSSKLGKPLKKSEQLRSMALLKKLIGQSKNLGWNDQDFYGIYVRVVDEVVKNQYINSFGFVYGPMKGILDIARPKALENSVAFTEEEIQREVERYKSQMLGG